MTRRFFVEPGVLDGDTLRFDRQNGRQDCTRFALGHCRVLRLQQREHLAVLLQFIAKCFNDLFEGRGHRSMTEERAMP